MAFMLTTTSLIGGNTWVLPDRLSLWQGVKNLVIFGRYGHLIRSVILVFKADPFF